MGDIKASMNKEMDDIRASLEVLKWQFGLTLSGITGFCVVSSNWDREIQIYTDTGLSSSD